MKVMTLDAIPLRRAPTNLRELLESSLRALRLQADAADVALRIEVNADVPPSTSIDRGKIAWAVTALVGNALRYVPRGSQTMPGGSITVHAFWDPSERRVVIDVQDDGPGIPPDRLRALLASLSDANDGAALGLAMVRDIVVAHGGTFEITSDTGAFSRGTNVRFTLPAAA